MRDALDASYKGFLEYGDIVQYHLGPRIVYIVSLWHAYVLKASLYYPKERINVKT